MSTRTRTITRESSSTESLKRKSIDPSDVENLSPNQEVSEEKAMSKKSRLGLRSSVSRTDSIQDKPSSKASVAVITKPRSALPRYTSSKGTSVAESKRRAATEKATAERSDSTPLRDAVPLSPPKTQLSGNTPRRTSLSKTTASRRKSTRKSLLKINGGRIKAFFESCSLVDEDKLNETIVPKLRVKCKWDYRDKANRQTEVITDLKNAYKQNLSEVKSLQEKCEGEEKILQELIYDLRKELQDTVHLNVELKRNETQLKKDYARLSNEYNSCNSKLKALEKEMPPLLRELDFLKQKYDVSENELKVSSVTLQEKERLLSEMTILTESLKHEKASIAMNLKGSIDEATEKYREEILQLRIELEKRQYDVEKTCAEREDMQDKFESHKEVVMRLESKLRESESIIQRLEREEIRQSSEISELKSQLSQKDNDLRMTLASMQEYQRNSTEERVSLRAEISALQPRVAQLEEQRLQDKFELATKREELQNVSKDLNNLREAYQSMQFSLIEREKELGLARESMVQLSIEKEMRARSEMREDAERNERIAACAQLLATQYDCTNRLKESEEKLKSTVDSLNLEIIQSRSGLESEIQKSQSLIEKIAILEGEISQYKHALEHAHAEANYEAVAELGRVKGEVEILRVRIAELNEHKYAEGNAASNRIRELESQLAEKDVQRRKLHNLVQELRGNVRVFARVRPFLPDDVETDQNSPPESSIITRHDNSGLKIINRSKTSEKQEDYSFTFDKVFGQSASQESVFLEVSEFVQSALDGYHVCLFSYGQTGSGKTYTMQGSGDGPMRGIIPRAIQQVGHYKLLQEEKGWEYEMEDLLRGDHGADLKHEIKKDAMGNTYVSDVVMLTLNPNDITRVEEIMQLAARHRSVGQTAMNAQSSRSHSIFTLHLKARNSIDGVVLKGALNLVDLAGSERLDRSGATGSQMRETLAINKSLSALTDVFVAIANKQTHIPFRNSKLTHLLQPALSGEGKALMMVNLSPTDQSYYESLCSLRFASQVNQCELGKPKRYLKEANPTSSIPPPPSSAGSRTASGSAIPSAKISTAATTSSVKINPSKPPTPSRPIKSARLK